MARRFLSSSGGGLVFARRLPRAVVVLLFVQLALAVSAIACEGTGGPPDDPTPIEDQGSGSNPGAPGLGKEECGKVVDCATGDETTEQTDTVIGGRGFGLNIVRSYDAQAAATAQAEGKGLGPWGWGWTGPYEVRLVFGTSEVGQETATVEQQNGSGIVFYKEESGEYAQGGWVEARLVKAGSDYIYTLPTLTKLEFNSSGELVKETERDGNATTLTYNGSKQLEKVTDSSGRTLTFKYNGEGLVESIKDPMGHVVSYTYTAKILSTVSIEGKVRWEFGYTSASPYLLASVTDGRKHTTTLEYDGSHRVIKETIAGHVRKWSYGENETTITEPNGSETVDTFNAAQEPTKIIQAKGTGVERVTEYEYSGTTFELTKMIDPNKHVTEYGYDSEGNRTSEKDPNGDEHKWEYDKNHNVIQETTPEGETTTIKRSEAGEPEVIERPVGSETQKTEYKYDAYGDITEVVDPLGHKTKYTYDSHGDKESETDAEGNKRKWVYNTDSQEVEETDPRGYTTKTERNEYGLPVKITDPLGDTTEYKYDGDQNVESETDGNKHTTKYEYNEENLPTKITKPNGDTTETGYDAEGQKTSYTDGSGHTWEYKRNQLEQITEEKNPLGKVWTKTYDKAGNLEMLEDPEKHTTEYAYDETNRLKKIKYSTGKPSEVTYEYNKDSKVTKMKDETGTTENTWDKLDRLTEYKNGAGKTVKYEYNLANEPSKVTYPNGEHITREYDKDNRLEKVVDWKGNTTSFKYNADSEPTTTTFPSGTENKDEYEYNEADQLKEIKMKKGSASLGTLAYKRDHDGLIQETNATGELAFFKTEVVTLDENNRLGEDVAEKSETMPYSYDKANNPTTRDGATYTYNSADELTEGPVNYPAFNEKDTYNNDGEMTATSGSESTSATSYTYDQAGNLTAVGFLVGPEEGSLAYTYDGNNLRETQARNGVKANLTWNTVEAMPEIINDETNSYIYGPGGLPIEQVSSSGEVLYFHHDQQGSTRLLTNSKGEEAGKYAYEPFGLLIWGSGTNTPLRYDGQYASGPWWEGGPELIYLRARTYDPETAQFLSVDPALQATGEPYTYAQNDPENRSDESGLCATGGKSLGQCLLLGAEIVYSAIAVKLGYHTGEVKEIVELRKKIQEFLKECKNMKVEGQAALWAVEEKLKALRQTVQGTISQLEHADPAQKAIAAAELAALGTLAVALSPVGA